MPAKLRVPWQELAAGLALGALAALGQPGIDLYPLFFLALVLLAYRSARAAGWLSAALLGAGFGVGLFAVLTISARDWGNTVPVALTLIGVGVYALPLALCNHWCARRFEAASAFSAMAASWALCLELGELVGFPSRLSAISAVCGWAPLGAGARLVGANVISGILMAGTAGIGRALALPASRAVRWRAAASPLAASLGILALLAVVAHLGASASTGSLSVGVPQLNLPSDYFRARQGLPGKTELADALVSAELAELPDVQLIAFTENFDGRLPLQVPRVRERYLDYARLHGQGLLLTSYLVAENGGGFNAVAAITPEGQIAGIHRKVDLAPFGEAGLDPGPGYRVLAPLARAPLGVLICQESSLARGTRAFVRGGAKLLVASTSDTSFKSGMLPFEHLAQTRLRAIEYGRDIVWASNSGPSGIINRWGEFEPGAPFREARAVKLRANLYDDVTSQATLPWLWDIAAVVLLVVALGTTRAPARDSGSVSVAGDPLALLGAFTVVGALAVVSPALVEFRHGVPARASAAVRELLSSAPPVLAPNAFERFRVPPDRTAEGALAFYLDFYGSLSYAADIHLPLASPSLADLQAYLEREQTFPTREIALGPSGLPGSATLVALKAGGYAVLIAPRAGLITLFSPSEATLRALRAEDVPKLLEPRGLLAVAL